MNSSSFPRVLLFIFSLSFPPTFLPSIPPFFFALFPFLPPYLFPNFHLFPLLPFSLPHFFPSFFPSFLPSLLLFFPCFFLPTCFPQLSSYHPSLLPSFSSLTLTSVSFLPSCHPSILTYFFPSSFLLPSCLLSFLLSPKSFLWPSSLWFILFILSCLLQLHSLFLLSVLASFPPSLPSSIHHLSLFSFSSHFSHYSFISNYLFLHLSSFLIPLFFTSNPFSSFPYFPPPFLPSFNPPHLFPSAVLLPVNNLFFLPLIPSVFASFHLSFPSFCLSSFFPLFLVSFFLPSFLLLVCLRGSGSLVFFISSLDRRHPVLPNLCVPGCLDKRLSLPAAPPPSEQHPL